VAAQNVTLAARRFGRREAAVAVAAIVATASYRFLSLTGFPDDHYVHLAGAQQMLFGAWPSRDFVDLGAPLTYAVSAAAQRLFGQSQLTEAVLMAVSFGLAAALTLRAGVSLTGSILFGAIAMCLEVIVLPRSYSYPKMIIYAAAALTMLWYAHRPSVGRLVVLAVLTVVAMLIRHDHGVFVGAGAVVAVALSPVPSDRRKGVMSVALLAGAVALLSVPYAIYLQPSGGVLAHLQRGAAFAALQADSQRLRLRSIPAHEAWMLMFLWLAPVIAAALVLVRARTHAPDSWTTVRRVVPLIALALIVNAGLIRDQLEVRMPDAIVAPALLLAWLVTETWRPHPFRHAIALRAAGLAAVAFTLWSASIIGHTPEQLDRMGVFNGIDRLPSRFGERAEEMTRPWVGRQTPSATAQALRPFFDFTDRCVPRDGRVLVAAFLPEVPVLARRAFAGGQVWFLPGALATPSDHALVMQRLSGERVAFAVIRHPTYDAIAREFPELDAYIKERFTSVAEWSLGDDDRVVLLADARQSTSRDAATGWPCFR
jgi:hypothetical protein